MKLKLDTITNLATLATCAAVAYVAWQARQPQAPPVPSTYERGEHIVGLRDVDFRQAPQTLLVVMRKDCHYCEESVPFYQGLFGNIRDDVNKRTQVIAVTVDDKVTADAYFAGNNLQFDRIVSVSQQEMRRLKLPVTPILILANDAGVVSSTWVGKLGSDGEKEVREKVLGQSLVSTQKGA
jgi:hypothetical protein